MKRLAQTTSQPAQKALKVENHDSRWQRIGSLLLFKSSIEGSKQGERKIASFDLDCTLIKTKSGTVFARDEHDWQFLNNQVPATLQSFKEQQYDIIIFTNQNGLKNQEKIDEFKRKISAISKALDVNFTLLAALEKDEFRKPMVGMFTFIQRMFGEINLPDSFYVGDASGRHQNWISGYKKDHSDADRKFALNNRLPFHIPETFFLRLNVPALPNLSFDPHNLFSNRTTISPLPAFGTLFEIIILVGIPAIGKSFFVERYLKKYIHASQDILKTKAKCIKLVEESLKSKLSVVIDNTNPDIQTRKVWIDLAKKYNANARVIHFNGSYELAIHNNNYRKFNAEKNVPTIAFNTYRKNFIEPSISEGISSIHIVDFDFEFKDEEAKEKWLLHY